MFKKCLKNQSIKIIDFIRAQIHKNPHKFFLFLSFFASIFALASAYISQYIFGLEPCILCLHQRKPFFIIIIISALFLFMRKLMNHQKIGTILCVFLFLINAGIAFYHSGVELKIFAGPKNCASANFDNADNLEELKELIMATKAVRCDIPQFYFLKLTMANWNVIFCMSLLIIAWWLTKFYKKSTK